MSHNLPHSILVTSLKLTGLKPDTRYYYQVGVPDNGTSEVMSFFTKDGDLVFAVSTTFDVTHASARHAQIMA